MKRLLPIMFTAALLGLCTIATPSHAQPIKARAYAPENVSQLSVVDQRRVIELEYREQSSGRTIPEDQMRFYLDQVRLSRWTFSQIKADIAQSLGRGGGYGGDGNLPDQNTVRCESRDDRQQNCTTPWQGPSRLVRQLSDTRCVAGQNWSSARGQVWVSGGCRAEFAAGIANGGAGREVRCESDDGRPRTCPTPWPGASDLLQQLSDTACISGRNWSSSRGEIRVSGGCRAVFVSAAGVGVEEIRCESGDGRYHQCGAKLYGRARLTRQLSDRRCVEGSNWGLQNGSIWVDDGCRGIFEVDASGSSSGNPDTDNTVVCASQENRYTRCTWDRSRGTPRLLQTLSGNRCTEGVSWGYSARIGLWVSQGCRARFGVR